MLSLFVLALGLASDNARVALGLGALPLSLPRRAVIALTFALWDGTTPLFGFLLAGILRPLVAPWADRVGPLVLLLYGGWLLLGSLRRTSPQHLDDRVILLGLPFSLSLDNLIAGTGLGLFGYPPLLSCLILAGTSGSLSFAALTLGRATARFLPLRAELLSGAILLALGGLMLAGWM